MISYEGIQYHITNSPCFIFLCYMVVCCLLIAGIAKVRVKWL